jgi:hypothetical protein
MKFVLALVTFALMAFLLSWGILSAVQPNGKPWLLVAGIAAFITLFSRVGCAEEH